MFSRFWATERDILTLNEDDNILNLFVQLLIDLESLLFILKVKLNLLVFSCFNLEIGSIIFLFYIATKI